MLETARRPSRSRVTSSRVSSNGRWSKRGRIFVPDGSLEWLRTHAALPCTAGASDSVTRVYFSGRNDANRAHIGWFDFDPHNPKRVSLHPLPALAPGTLGAFDDSGVTVSCVVPHDGKLWLYYTGWSLGVTVPFYLAIGLAISDDGETFTRISEAPILGRNAADPYLTASPSVMFDGDRWRMWYVSCQRWEENDGEPKHYYHIRYAESQNGVNWDYNGHICIDFEDETEYAFGRPCVVRDEDCYRMWYCVRGDAYRIGYAESADGKIWDRKDDQVGITESEVGWDSIVTAYPHVFQAADTRWMLYNGNDYGKTGIGLAEWV